MTDIAANIPVIDVDTHLLEPADLWTKALPKKWHDQAPHVVSDPKTGRLRWQVGDTLVNPIGMFAQAGWGEYPPSCPPTWEDIQPGAYDPVERLKQMDAFGIQTQVLYANIVGFHGWALLKLDPEVRNACVRVYNDYQTEFCATDPTRLVPITVLPFWDVEASVAELIRCAEMGHKGLNFGCNFEKFDMPMLRDPHWDPILSTCQELGHSLNFHIGFGSRTEEEVANALSVREALDLAKNTALLFLGNASSIAEVIMSGLCERYPRLNFVSVESGYGYVPFLLEILDWQFLNMGVDKVHRDYLLPSEYFRRQIYASFWFETGLERMIDLYPDNVMFESDYPHATSLSPGPATVAKSPHETINSNLSSVPRETLEKILHGNAARLYKLEETVSTGGSAPAAQTSAQR